MPKRKRRSKRRSTRLAALKSQWRNLQDRASIARWRRVALGVMAAVTLALLVAFGVTNRAVAFYALVLAAGSLGIGLAVWPRVTLGLTAVFLYLQPLIIYLPHSEYSFTKAVVSVWAISVLGLIWAGRWAFTGKRQIRLTSMIWPFLAVLGAGLLSLANGVGVLVDLQYVIIVACFGIFGLFVANHATDQASIRVLIRTLLGSASLASLYALLQYFGVSEGSPDAAQGADAIISTFGNRNYLGGFLAYLVAPGLWLLLDGRSSWERGFALSALALCTMTLVAIDSDSAWLAFVLSIGVMIIGLAVTRDGTVLKRRWPWTAGLAGAACALTLLLHVGTRLWVDDGPLAPQGWLDVAPVVGWAGLLTLALVPLVGLAEDVWHGSRRRRLGIIVGAMALVVGFLLSPVGQEALGDVWNVATSGSAQIRAQDWWIGWHMFADHPIVGTGIGDYKREFLTYKAEFLDTPRGQAFQDRIGHIRRAAEAHNEYVQILAEMGLVGIASAGFFLVMLVRSAVRRVRAASDPAARRLALALAGGLVAFLSDAVFSFPLHLPANALAFVTLLGLLHSAPLGNARVRIELPPRAAQATAAIALVAFGLLSLGAYRDSQADIWLERAKRFATTAPAQVEPLLERSIRLDVAPSEALYWLGRAKLAQGDLSAARHLLTRAHRLYQTEDSFYYAADAHFRSGNVQQARRYLERLLEADPQDSLRPRVRYLHALVLYRDGQPEAAIETLQALLDADYQPIKMHVNLGEIYADTGEADNARSHLQQALAMIERELDELAGDASPRRQELQRLRRRAEQLLGQVSP